MDVNQFQSSASAFSGITLSWGLNGFSSTSSLNLVFFFVVVSFSLSGEDKILGWTGWGGVEMGSSYNHNKNHTVCVAGWIHTLSDNKLEESLCGWSSSPEEAPAMMASFFSMIYHHNLTEYSTVAVRWNEVSAERWTCTKKTRITLLMRTCRSNDRCAVPIWHPCVLVPYLSFWICAPPIWHNSILA